MKTKDFCRAFFLPMVSMIEQLSPCDFCKSKETGDKCADCCFYYSSNFEVEDDTESDS